MYGRKAAARVAALAMVCSGLVGLGAVTGASPAMACGEDPSRSDHLAHSLPQVRYGERSMYVLGLQLELKEHGYKLRGTGYYGPKTLAAVKSYQRKNHIRASGIVGSKTWHKLVGSQPPDLTGNGVMMRYVPGFQVRPGDRDERHVQALSEVLQRVAQSYDWLDEGSYGPKTQAVVKQFQREVGIRPSGIVGPKTWHALYEVTSIAGHWGC
ncbi:MAG TPA: peptidoglycan-binding protein [Kribbellaceae bacterium]|nr:peptidoglycan-binding protein [Kribbellaceae bacterium]